MLTLPRFIWDVIYSWPFICCLFIFFPPENLPFVISGLSVGKTATDRDILCMHYVCFIKRNRKVYFVEKHLLLYARRPFIFRCLLYFSHLLRHNRIPCNSPLYLQFRYKTNIVDCCCKHFTYMIRKYPTNYNTSNKLLII